MGLLENSKFAVHIMNTLNMMRQNNEFCDLVFDINNCKFSAHQLVVASWSLPMKNLLQLQPASTQHVHVAYDKPDVFHMFITVMYTGVLPSQVPDIAAILLLAATFQIQLLTKLCEEHLKMKTVIDDVIKIFLLSIHFQLQDLEQHCVEFLCKHLKEITQKLEFQNLTPAQINSLLGSLHMLKYDPEIKLCFITSWLAKDSSNREQFLVPLLKHVEWSQMTDGSLKDFIQTENFLTSNPSSLYLLLQTVYSSNVSLEDYVNQFQLLQKKFGHLLNSIVKNSDMVTLMQPKHFQPLIFSLVSPSVGDANIINRKMNSASSTKVKSESEQFLNFDKNEVIIYRNSVCSDVSQNHVNPTENIPVDHTSKMAQFGSISLDTLSSLENEALLEEVCVVSGHSVDVENRTQRQVMKPHRIIKNSAVIKNAVLKDFQSKEKKSNSIRQHRRSETREKIASGTRMTTRLTSSKITESLYAKPGPANTDVSPRAETRTKHSTKPLHSCSQCDYTAYSHLSIEKHHKQVHEGNCLFCCCLCSFKTKWSKEFYDHMQQLHFPGPPFRCDGEQCDYNTDKFQQLISHRRQHGDQRPFVCDVCLMAFKSRNNLYQHFKIHSDEKKFPCLECGRSFKLKNTLEQHMVTHSDLRPYLCDLCGFCTKFQSHLISHKRIHTGEVYRCNFESCAYSTPKKSQLKSHMRSHLGIRCHICGSCGKAFIEKSHLIRHERTHSSEKAHVCKECSYSSTRVDKLKEHVQKHHGEEIARVKTASLLSKKLDASRKSKVKVTSIGHNDDVTSDQVTEVEAIIKNKDLSADFVVPEIVTSNLVAGNDISIEMFHSDLSQQLGSPEGVAPPTTATSGRIVNHEFNKTYKFENATCAVEIGNIKESTYGCQVTGDLTSMSCLNGPVVAISCSNESDRGAITDEFKQQTAETLDVSCLPYASDMSSSIHVPKPNMQRHELPPQLSQHVMDELHAISSSSNPSSVEMLRYYHSQPHKDHQEPVDIETSEDFLSDDNYLF